MTLMEHVIQGDGGGDKEPITPQMALTHENTPEWSANMGRVYTGFYGGFNLHNATMFFNEADFLPISESGGTVSKTPEEDSKSDNLVMHLPIAASLATTTPISEFTYRDARQRFRGTAKNPDGIGCADAIQAITIGELLQMCFSYANSLCLSHQV